jgi:hypothetical protein
VVGSWPLYRLVKENEDVRRVSSLPQSLIAFADDGTGNPFCVAIDDDRIVRWSWIDSEVERSAGTAEEFLAEWT